MVPSALRAKTGRGERKQDPTGQDKKEEPRQAATPERAGTGTPATLANHFPESVTASRLISRTPT
jgi:hypothetical protein